MWIFDQELAELSYSIHVKVSASSVRVISISSDALLIRRNRSTAQPGSSEAVLREQLRGGEMLRLRPAEYLSNLSFIPFPETPLPVPSPGHTAICSPLP